MVVDLIYESPVMVISERPHRKGRVESEAHDVDEGTAGSWEETPVIWPNLEDSEASRRVYKRPGMPA